MVQNPDAKQLQKMNNVNYIIKLCATEQTCPRLFYAEGMNYRMKFLKIDTVH